MGTIVLQEIYHIFKLILCSQIFIGIFLWSSSASSNSVQKVALCGEVRRAVQQHH